MFLSSKNRITIIGGGLVLLGLLIFVSSRSRFFGAQKQRNMNQKIHVIATIYPLGDFAKNVGGELVEVTTITPPGVEPHEYEPTPQDLVKMQAADLVLINGNGVDPWAEKLMEDLRSKKITVVRMSDDENIAFLPGDPHFWLDPHLAQQMVRTITWSLREFRGDSTERDDTIVAQGEAYVRRLTVLDQAYFEKLASCERHEIVTSHNAFRYLAQRYNLKNYYILGLSPEEDPSPKTIAKVADEARQKGVRTIFFETLVSPKLSQTIAHEIGAKTAVLNPIEGLTTEDLHSGKDYVSVMEENLAQLRAALNCL